MDMTRTYWLLATAISCTCGINLRQQVFGAIAGKLVSFNISTAYNTLD